MVKFFISEKEGEWNLVDNKTGKESPPLKEDFKLVTRTYIDNKPRLEEVDVYQLKLCNLAITDNSEVTGQLIYIKNNIIELVTINK